MSRFITSTRKTDYLMPPSVEDRLNQDHLARFIVEVIDELDLSNLIRQYAGHGSKVHHPATLLAILMATQTAFSPAASSNTTRSRFALSPAAAIPTTTRWPRSGVGSWGNRGLVRAGAGTGRRNEAVCLDGTKIHTNASRHSALSYGHIENLETRLKAEVQELLALAERADQANVPDGMSLPEEPKRREDRLAVMAVAKAKLAVRAKERYARERAEYEQKMANRAAREEEAAGRKLGGKAPVAPEADPWNGDQINLTDEQSRIMPVTGDGDERLDIFSFAGSHVLFAEEARVRDEARDLAFGRLRDARGKDQHGGCIDPGLRVVALVRNRRP